MTQDYLLYEKMDVMDKNLPIIFHEDHMSIRTGLDHFSSHWHDTIELLYFTKGEAEIKCNSIELLAKEGDLIVINSNELHQAFCASDSVDYYCIIFDTSLLQGLHVGACEAKYINPISQNRILFQNKVERDKEVARYIKEFVVEYKEKKIGYEMAVKATIYQLIVLLLRNHVQLTLTSKEYDERMRNLKRFNGILEYIENHYADKITIDKLCTMVHLSRFYFCREFKNITGKPLGQYLNEIKIGKAKSMLKDSDVNITEVALACGFDDISYFSRLFKKYEKVSPSSVTKARKNEADHA
jgi:AraC-like DNA-binding protein